MRKLLTLITFFFCSYNLTEAQYIKIPDDNFRSFLKKKFPSCFNAFEEMDTSCNQVLHLTALSVTPHTEVFKNIDGIQYFKSLDSLLFSGISIDTIGILPPKLTYLDLSNNNAESPVFTSLPGSLKYCNFSRLRKTHLPELPNSITHLIIEMSLIDTIVQLPSSLKYLDAWRCQNLRHINSFPKNLEAIIISEATLDSLPTIPLSLQSFTFHGKLDTLPIFPNSLRYLDCSKSNLGSFPALPDSLRYLNLDWDNLTLTLNNLPEKLETLSLFSNKITALPSLPLTLKKLIIEYCPISALPILPDSLTYLNCANSSLSQLPVLPSGLDTLFCFGNKFTSLPSELPPNLTLLSCGGVGFKNLPALPGSLKSLGCSYTEIRDLPALPNGIKTLLLRNDSLVSLPRLPDSLTILECPNNLLTSLPQLPKKLIQLICSNNQLTSLPALPDTMIYLDITQNKINCLPKIPQAAYDKYIFKKQLIIDFDNNEITCVPNIPPGVIFNYNPNIKLCNPTNNVNHCQSFPIITGKVFIDYNKNGVKDTNEYYKAGVKMQASNGNISYTNSNGYFEIQTDSTGAFTLTGFPPNHYNLIPSTVSYNFTSYDTIVSKDFAIQANSVKDSLTIKLTALTAAARPGFSFPYVITYENAGTTIMSPTITFNFDNTKLIYDSSSIAVSSSGNELLLSDGSIHPGEQKSFISYFKLKTTVAIGDSLTGMVTINDNNTRTFDSCKTFILGSYDPNDKEATSTLSLSQVASGEYIDYTIHFQNVGTDTAFNVVIADTLSSKLQAETFTPVSSSHPYRVNLINNIVYFELLNILLPDSNANERSSHGFVSFKIKPQASIAANSTIVNKAAIYFDYNSAVITNDANTFVLDYTTLPLSLMSFSATIISANETAILWSTINESGSEKFIIEQSENGTDFKSIATVNAKGMNFNTYNVTVDDHTSALVYYRLAVINNNGDLKYSAIVKLYKTSNNFLFTVFPDQLSRSLIISSSDKELDDSEAYLINVQGALVKKLMIKPGITTLKVPDLASGLYYLNTKKGTYKILLQ